MTPALILLCLAGYFSLLFVISYFTGRHARNETFFIGNRNSPWFLVAFGMIGASLSGVTFISIPGVVGSFGSLNQQFSYMQVVFGYLVGYFIIATVLMPLYYRLNLTSIYTYLEERFGFWSYKTGASFFLLSRSIGAAFRLYLVAIVLQRFVFEPWGVPFAATVILTLGLIWIYTFRGGIKTIVWTDTLQTLFMLVAVGISIYLIGQELGVGAAGLIDTVANSEYSRIFFFDDPSGGNYFWKQFVSGAFIAIVMTGLDQDMMQKNISCKTLGDAQKNMFTFSIILVFANLFFLALGALLYLYADAKGIAVPERTDYLFPTLALQYFSPIAGIAFILGLIAAAYSSADSALTALTTSFCVDFLGFEKHPTRGASKRLRYGIHMGFSVLLLGIILVFNTITDQAVITNVFVAAGYTYGPILGLYSFGLVSKRAVRDGYVPLVALLSPIISYIISANSVEWLGYKFGFEILILNGLLTFIGLLLISKRKT